MFQKNNIIQHNCKKIQFFYSQNPAASLWCLQPNLNTIESPQHSVTNSLLFQVFFQNFLSQFLAIWSLSFSTYLRTVPLDQYMLQKYLWQLPPLEDLILFSQVSSKGMLYSVISVNNILRFFLKTQLHSNFADFVQSS